MTGLEITKKIVEILNEKKAIDIKAIDVRGMTIIGDYFVIAESTSTTGVKALSDEVDEKLSKFGIEPKRREGYRSANWILLDYCDVIVHVFHSESRQFYALEKLWSEAPSVDLSDIITQN